MIWLSKHGVTCAKGNEQYPGVKISDKQNFWNEFTQYFDGIIFNQTESERELRDTTIKDLIRRDHRVVRYNIFICLSCDW